MADPAEQQAAYVELLTELALLHLYPAPLPPQPALPADTKAALEQMAEAMTIMYPSRGS